MEIETIRSEGIKYGVYLNRKTAQLGLLYISDDPRGGWEFDEGKSKPHPFFRVQVPYVKHGTGTYFLDKILKNYELIDEVKE